MGSRVAELDLLTSPVCNSEVMAAQRLVTLALMVLVYVCCSVEMSPVKRSPDALSLAEGNAEPIQALNGFYGNPIYRPYGFAAWGYGSAGYMSHALEIPNVYGGYHFYGFHG